MWTGIIVLHKITHPTSHFVYTFISHNNSNNHVTSAMGKGARESKSRAGYQFIELVCFNYFVMS